MVIVLPIPPNAGSIESMTGWEKIYDIKNNYTPGAYEHKINATGKNDYSELLQTIKDKFRKRSKQTKNWTINVQSSTLAGIPTGPRFEKEEELFMSFYTINTGKELPTNTYTG